METNSKQIILAREWTPQSYSLWFFTMDAPVFVQLALHPICNHNPHHFQFWYITRLLYFGQSLLGNGLHG